MKRNRSNFIVAIITLLTVTMLMACSGETPPADETKKTQTATVKEETTEVAEAKEKVTEPTPEPTAEPTPEPTPIVYDGIDMESTLPGKEWIATFEGIIDEPKFVVYNDETNKKIIVEDGQEVEFSQGDILAVYTLKGKALGAGYDGKHIETLVGYDISYTEIVFREVRKLTPNTISVDIVDEDNYVIQELTCKLKAPTN